MVQQKKKVKGKQKKEKDDRFNRVLSIIWMVLFLAVVAGLMLVMTGKLYQFGYDLFGEKPGTEIEIEIEFEVREGEAAITTAKRLKDKNLISSELIFLLQKILYDKDIIAGTHQLNSNMTTLQILEELSVGRVNDY